MAERGHRTSMDGSLESPSDASPVVKTKYGNVHGTGVPFNCLRFRPALLSVKEMHMDMDSLFFVASGAVSGSRG